MVYHVDMNENLINALSLRSEYTKAEKTIVKAIIDDTDFVISHSVTDFAQAISVSTASIVRFCKKAGLSGYPELRLELAKYTKDNVKTEDCNESDVANARSVEGVVSHVISSTKQSIECLRDLIDKNDVQKVVEAVLSSRNILIAGIGASSLAAQDLQQKLARIGIFSHFGQSEDFQFVQLVSMSEKDLLILFSYSGNTASIRKLAENAKSRGIKTVAITKTGKNHLASIADIVLRVSSRESVLREGASVSRIEQLLLVDIIYYSTILAKQGSLDRIVATWDAVKKE